MRELTGNESYIGILSRTKILFHNGMAEVLPRRIRKTGKSAHTLCFFGKVYEACAVGLSSGITELHLLSAALGTTKPYKSGTILRYTIVHRPIKTLHVRRCRTPW